MSITVKQLRDLIDGQPDDREVLVIEVHDNIDELVTVNLVGVTLGPDGTPRITVEISYEDDDDDDEEEDDEDDDEPTGSCGACGTNLYGTEKTYGLCDWCSWKRITTGATGG